MKKNLFYVGLALLSGLAFAGCQPHSEAAQMAEATIEIGPKYNAINGLFVPEETRASLGLKIIEVTEQKVPGSLEVQLRVYHAGEKSVLASASVTPEEAKVLKRGQPVRARLVDSELTGQVTGINDQLLKATGVAEVLVELTTLGTEITGAFLPGSILLDNTGAVVAVPRSALLESSDGHSVYTVSSDHLVRTRVQVGAISGGMVEIKDGLYAGDQVVLQPVMSLWMTELAAVKGGQACCVVPAKGK